MTEPDTRREVADDEAMGPVVRDKRRIDPETGLPRTPPGGAAQATTEEQPTVQEPTVTPAPAVDGESRQLTPDSDLAAERLRDLQRLQAEYVNYRRRVERDRDVARDTAVAGVLESLLPVLDDVHLARQHGDDRRPGAAAGLPAVDRVRRQGAARSPRGRRRPELTGPNDDEEVSRVAGQDWFEKDFYAVLGVPAEASADE